MNDQLLSHIRTYLIEEEPYTEALHPKNARFLKARSSEYKPKKNGVSKLIEEVFADYICKLEEV